MSIKTDIYRSALRDYDSIKSASEAKRRQIRDKVYKANPRLDEIDREINSAGVSATKNIIKNPDKKEEIQQELKAKLDTLNKEKAEIYDKLGITEDYFDSVYKCPKCKDTGMIGSEECSCFRQYLIQKAYGRALLNELSEEECFENFNINFYSKTEADRDGITPYENMKDVFGACLRFAERFGSQYKNLLLMGKTGLGKTFLCNCIAQEVLNSGYTVIYISAGRLFKTLSDEQFNRSDDEEYSSFYDDVLSVDLLIIDDLGTEFSTSLVSAQFFNIINERMANRRPTIISTNLTPDGIKEQYSDRVLSRITDEFELLRLTGKDIRVQKRYLS
ncbi:MAG: ATP-binding protein [Clostridiales bacterium]|nr:ATP-binding protein [Clostridiales bacterium]